MGSDSPVGGAVVNPVPSADAGPGRFLPLVFVPGLSDKISNTMNHPDMIGYDTHVYKTGMGGIGLVYATHYDYFLAFPRLTTIDE